MVSHLLLSTFFSGCPYSAPTYIRWASLRSGESLRYAGRQFIKGRDDDEDEDEDEDERLMRRMQFSTVPVSMVILLSSTTVIVAQDPNCDLVTSSNGINVYDCRPVFGVLQEVPTNEKPYLVYVGEPPFTEHEKLQTCQGRCVVEYDCAEGLTCRQRDPYGEPVGCQEIELLPFMKYCFGRGFYR